MIRCRHSNRIVYGFIQCRAVKALYNEAVDACIQIVVHAVHAPAMYSFSFDRLRAHMHRYRSARHGHAERVILAVEHQLVEASPVRLTVSVDELHIGVFSFNDTLLAHDCPHYGGVSGDKSKRAVGYSLDAHTVYFPMVYRLMLGGSGFCNNLCFAVQRQHRNVIQRAVHAHCVLLISFTGAHTSVQING